MLKVTFAYKCTLLYIFILFSLLDFFYVGFSGSGGGSGGRIGIYLSQPFDFRGTIGAYGGGGTPAGGPGTSYIQISDGISKTRILRIDGRNREKSEGLRVFLDELGGYYHLLDELELRMKAFVSLQQVW